jgi:hypothetical protein
MRTALVLFVLCSATAAQTVPQPTFYARQDYPGNGQVRVADLNGDKIPDVVATFGDRVMTLLGNGDGTFRVGPTTYPGMWTGGLAVLDLNGDGYPDLVMSAIGGGSGIGISFGNGDGTFQPAIDYAGGDTYLGQVAVGDFNGDGIPDVACPDDQGIWLFVGKGGGVFDPGVLASAGGYQSSNIVAADFNGDGKLDLAVSDGGFSVVFGNGDGTFQLPVNYNSPGYTSRFIAVGDINLDGHPDIALVLDEVSVDFAYIYLNNGSGGFTKSGAANLPGPAGFTIGDVNGDGIPDLVNNYGYVAFGFGNGKFKPAISYPIQSSGEGNPASGPALADLRNNGLTDMVFGDLSAISVLLSASKANFKDGVWTSLPGSGNCAAAADFNGDGKPDLAVPTTEGITVLLGTGKASAPYTIGASIVVSGPGCPIAGDLNGDGIPDLLFGASSAGGVVAYLGNGDGTFKLAGSAAVGSGVLVLGDFNHDGKLDFADSSNQLALGNGDGTFQAPVTIVANPPAEGYSWIAAGDVNNDGWTDLLLTNWNITQALYVLVNNHKGGFHLSAAIENGAGPLTVILADLNGDGNLDAVVDTYFGYDVLVYLGDGKGGFTLNGTLAYQGSYPEPPAVGDVNGDGIPDILMPSDGSIQIQLGNGDGTFTSMPSQGVGPGAAQILLENLHGQSPKAHLPDIVAPDSTGGVTVLINTTK